MTDTLMQKNGQTDVATAEGMRQVTLAPPVDILENEHELTVFADMPGVPQDAVDIRFDNGELTLHGRRRLPNCERGYFHCEVEAFDYFRSFRISEMISVDKISAELKNGVLTLHLPKVEAVKPRKIVVRS